MTQSAVDRTGQSPQDLFERLDVRAGFHSAVGGRETNEDYVAYGDGSAAERAGRGLIFAVADGVGGAKGGRVAAELTVRSLIDGYLSQNAMRGVQRNAVESLQAINRWLHAIGRQDEALAGMACTLTALILRGRSAHVVHVGDSRLYRLRGTEFVSLTTDHVPGPGGLKHILTRAVGFEAELRVDYCVEPARLHDRYLLVSDGVHGAVSDIRMLDELACRNAPEDAARRLVDAALVAGLGDNATALVADIIGLPPPNQLDIEAEFAAQPILPPPKRGEVIDGFELQDLLSDGRYSRVFKAYDTINARAVVLKFPKALLASDAGLRQAFLREAWIAARAANPWIGDVLDIPPERRSCVYTAMPFYDGETLEQRLRRRPAIPLRTGLSIAITLAKAVSALHRVGVIHRDIKPDNVSLLTEGGLKLIDLGVARLPKLEDQPPEDVPGTPSYMAPEMLEGGAGDEQTDLFALGVTIFRMLTGAYPYGEVEAFSHPRFGQPASLLTSRPDLPAWLDHALARAYAVAPNERYGDVIEFTFALEHGAAIGARPRPRWRPLYERNPVLVWQLIAGVLAALLAGILWRR